MGRQQTELLLRDTKCDLIMDERSSEPSCSFSHVHTNFELFYVWHGEVEIKTDSENFTIGERQAALIAPACYHQTFSKPGTEKFNLFFSFAKTNKRSGDVYDSLAGVFSGITVKVITSTAEIEAGLLTLRKIRVGDCFCREERLKAELTKLLLSLYDILSEQASSLTNSPNTAPVGMQYRYEIDRLLSKNYAKDIDLAFLADSLYLSKKRVAVLIKSLYGKSFRRVRTEMRIQVAKQLLKESELTVSQIGTQVGYGSTRGFLEAFSELTGKTPSEYRAAKRAEVFQGAYESPSES